MNEEELHWLRENLKTCRNLIDTSIILLNIGKEHLLPTQLEFLFEVVQEIVDDHCVVRNIPSTL